MNLWVKILLGGAGLAGAVYLTMHERVEQVGAAGESGIGQ